MKQQKMKFLNGSSALLLESSKRVACDTLALLNSSIVEVFNDRALTGSCAETLRVLSAWSPKTEHDKIARSLVLLAAYRAEQSSPSAAYLFLRLLSGEKISKRIPKRMLQRDLCKLLLCLRDPTVESLVLDAVTQSGAAGNVSVTTGGITHLSVDESASFPIIVSPSFRNATTLTSRKLVTYDGVIESVGQINGFLESCAKENAKVMLLARSFSSEVASTIYANNQRGVFDIVPATPGMSPQDEFTLVDVAAIMNQSLSPAIKLEDSLNEADMTIEKGVLKIQVREVSGRNQLVSRLREELRQFKDYDIMKLLSERVRRISSRRVMVCIGEEFGSSKDIVKERFDLGMRTFVSARRKGVVEIYGDLFSGDSLNIATTSKDAFEKLIKNTGGVLVIDKDMEMAKRRSNVNGRVRSSHERQGNRSIRRV